MGQGDAAGPPGRTAALWGPLQALGPERALGETTAYLGSVASKPGGRPGPNPFPQPQHHAQPLEPVVAPWGGAQKHQPRGLSEGPWAEGAPWPALSSWPEQAGSHPSHLARPSDTELLRQDAQGHSGPPAVQPAASGTPFWRRSARADGYLPRGHFTLRSLCTKLRYSGWEPSKLLVAGPVHRGLRKKTKLVSLGPRSQGPTQGKFPVTDEASLISRHETAEGRRQRDTWPNTGVGV